MQATADAVIIGGGIIGASTLYYLAENGIHNVVLLERNTLGSGTTAYTAAWVRLQQETELGIRMAQISFKEFDLLRSEFDIGFQAKGSVTMNTVDFSDSERQLAGLQESMGVSTEILTAEDIKSIAPFLNVEDIGIGRFCKEDGIVDAHALLQVYIKKARALGATVEEGVDVINIVTEHDKIVGIETTQGFISTPILINAAGIYADQVGRWAGIDIPINKRLGHIIFTEPIPSVPEDMPLLEIMNPELIYIGSSRKRVDYTVGDLDTDSFEHKPNLDLILEKHFDDLFYRASDIARAGIVNCTAGVRAATPDGIPILGPVEQVSGFINNCGLGGNGIIYSPCVGKLVAQYITGTNKMPLSIEPFLLKRFYSQ